MERSFEDKKPKKPISFGILNLHQAALSSPHSLLLGTFPRHFYIFKMGATNYINLLLHLGLMGGALALPQDVALLKNGIKDWLSPPYVSTQYTLQNLY